MAFMTGITDYEILSLIGTSYASMYDVIMFVGTGLSVNSTHAHMRGLTNTPRPVAAAVGHHSVSAPIPGAGLGSHSAGRSPLHRC